MKFFEFLNSSKAYYILLSLNVIIGAIVFFIFRETISGDHFTYLGLAEGIEHGQYSYWYFLDTYTPDTFRTPGYPLFLVVLKFITNNLYVIKGIQLLLYYGAIWLILNSLKLYNKELYLRNVFLLLLLPNIQIVHYSAYIFPEILMVFFLAVFVYLNIALNEGVFKALIIGIIFGIAFQVRPIFLFFPLCYTFINLVFLRDKIRLKYSLITLIVYGLTLIPYGVWNYSNHGIFKVTPLEGGGGILHLGFWQHKLPNYYDERYWTTYYGSEIVRFVKDDQRSDLIANYNKEWDYIDSICAPYLTKEDLARLPEMQNKNNRELFKTYSANFTIKREQILKELTINHIKEEPLFYFKAKLYSAIRLFITGINPDTLKLENNIYKKIGLLIPTLITGTLFLLSILFIPWAYIKYDFNKFHVYPALSLVLYYWAIHIPMAIQSRYTIPIQIILIYILSIAIFELLRNKRLLILK